MRTHTHISRLSYSFLFANFSQFINQFFKYGVIAGLLLVCSIFFAVAGIKLSAQTGGKNFSDKVLIVSNINKPDDPVILKVTQMLKKKGYYVKLGFATNLKRMQAGKYGAIIIVNFIDDKAKERSVEVFADESVQKRIVLLNAVGDYLSPGEGQESSKTVKAEKIAFDIVEKTKIILSKQ